MEVEEPVSGRDAAAFDFHATLTRVLGPTLIRDQIIEVRQPDQKRLLAARGMMEPLHGGQLPLDRVMRLIQECARRGHLRVGEHRIPPGFLLLAPAPDALAIDHPRRVGDAVGKVASPLAERKHAQAFALSRPVQQGVELRVVYPRAADIVLGLPPSRLREVNQPVISTPNVFSSPCPCLFACIRTHGAPPHLDHQPAPWFRLSAAEATVVPGRTRPL